MVIGPHHGFAADFGGAVEILIIERMVLFHGIGHGVSVNRGGRGIDKTADIVANAGIHHVEGAADIDLKRGARKFMALQQPKRCEVKYAILAAHRCIENIGM